MPRCSMCKKWSLFGFAVEAAKPTRVKCLQNEFHKRYVGTKYATSPPMIENEDSNPIATAAGLLLLNELLNSDDNHHESTPEPTPEPFEGNGGEFGGAGATGGWDPAEPGGDRSVESSMSIPSEDHTSEDISESSSGSSEPSSESSDSSDSGGSDS